MRRGASCFDQLKIFSICVGAFDARDVVLALRVLALGEGLLDTPIQLIKLPQNVILPGFKIIEHCACDCRICHGRLSLGR